MRLVICSTTRLGKDLLVLWMGNEKRAYEFTQCIVGIPEILGCTDCSWKSYSKDRLIRQISLNDNLRLPHCPALSSYAVRCCARSSGAACSWRQPWQRWRWKLWPLKAAEASHKGLAGHHWERETENCGLNSCRCHWYCTPSIHRGCNATILQSSLHRAIET